MRAQKKIILSPPQLSLNNLKEKIICVRTHRERIFQVSAIVENGKLICHNYGQGGAGWTFLFGCVHESIRQFEKKLREQSSFKDQSIAVIGAGCYGMLTAIILTRKGYNVRIIAKETENIPSKKAAGFFFPRPRKSSTREESAIFQSLGIESYKTYLDIINGTHPFIKEGPKIVPAYYDPAIDPGFSPYITQGLIQQGEKVTIDFNNGKIYDAIAYHCVFINSALIMQELERNIKELGIMIHRAEVKNFQELPETIIFNCAGKGAQELSGDKRIVSVQGHLILLKNQSDVAALQYMVNFRVTQMTLQGRMRDELIYFAPKGQGILGITFLRGQDSENSNHHEFDRLIERCKDFFGT